MKYLTTAEIREAYLGFFAERAHKRMPSASLVPDDPSLLLTSAGMVQFKPYFLQQKHLEPPFVGTTTAQKCVRTNDIDVIGHTGRHLSFFEMLGNFSFGEYFKQEACKWALDFSLDVLELPLERLHFTVFETDDEAIGIWKALGVDESHITRLGEDDNFWRAGPTGPCGPCSELYYDQGEDVGCGSSDCAPGCDCDRFLEYWNLVFTQYDAQEDGTLAPLPKKNIDTGMGLERMASIMQGVRTNYETDVMRSLITVGERLSGRCYGQNAGDDLGLRIMADHSRSVTFMIADGILPSNEGRGYVLRRLLRRAVMKAHLLGIEGAFLNEFIDEIVLLMGDAYPEVRENRELMRRIVLSEEERFGSTLRQGQAYLEEVLAKLSDPVLGGKEAFTLHDTYGFPLEVTQEITAERGIEVDTAGFELCMREQKERARAHAKGADNAWSSYDGLMSEIREELGATTFLGYSETQAKVKVLAIVRDGERVLSAKVGETIRVFCDRTPFYAEKGGQVGDIGTMRSFEGDGTIRSSEGDIGTTDSLGDEGTTKSSENNDGSGVRVELEILDTREPEAALVAHEACVLQGVVAVGDMLEASVDIRRRERVCRNHTATHILHRMLREVLGEHVKQAGSHVSPDRLRFDFTHFEAPQPEQLAQVERLSNAAIMENRRVSDYECSLEEARAEGVVALFGEKYGDVVRVLDIEGVSRELCGGTHVKATGEIGFVKVTGESSVGANLRRIEAVTSYAALDYVNSIEEELRETAAKLRVPIFDVSERTAANLRQWKEIREKGKAAKTRATTGFDDLLLEAYDVGYPLVIARVDDIEAGVMRNGWDIVRARMAKPGAIILVGNNQGTPLLMAAASDEAVAAGFDAGAVIKHIAPHVKGGGGGKPTMAQAGGKDPSGLDAALDAARRLFVE